MRKIAVLGASGFLGREIVSKLLELGFEVKPLYRRSDKISENVDLISSDLRNFRPDAVINCMASWGAGVSNRNQIDSNLWTPLGVLLGLTANTKLWVQCNSYFNKYYERYAIDKDYYSLLKRMFTEQASKISAEEETFSVHEVMLPHLVGPMQRNSNLVPQAFEASRNKKLLKIGSGTQILPVLSVSDAASEIAAKLAPIELGKSQQSDINPVEEITVLQLLEKIQNTTGAEINLDSNPKRDRQNEFYDSIYSQVGSGNSNTSYKSLDEILGEF